MRVRGCQEGADFACRKRHFATVQDLLRVRHFAFSLTTKSHISRPPAWPLGLSACPLKNSPRAHQGNSRGSLCARPGLSRRGRFCVQKTAFCDGTGLAPCTAFCLFINHQIARTLTSVAPCSPRLCACPRLSRRGRFWVQKPASCDGAGLAFVAATLAGLNALKNGPLVRQPLGRFEYP